MILIFALVRTIFFSLYKIVNNYKTLKISIGAIIKNWKMLKLVPDHLKTKTMRKNAVKKLLFVVTHDSD